MIGEALMEIQPLSWLRHDLSPMARGLGPRAVFELRICRSRFFDFQIFTLFTNVLQHAKGHPRRPTTASPEIVRKGKKGRGRVDLHHYGVDSIFWVSMLPRTYGLLEKAQLTQS